ncbi:hypothetical protein [Actinomadura verrucosospora]|uniref:Uncharacterized protein n=1 Tax=Actinomadura verrucosospora TaxID=46165 RepID=A0A7D3ZW04_ACTVE|nr:hypothetical protein [Actinomadura verrucosospora]QKG20446.1 hypothetical protein ACTIVE_2084 [Actinomadura verrucosospora]
MTGSNGTPGAEERPGVARRDVLRAAGTGAAALSLSLALPGVIAGPARADGGPQTGAPAPEWDTMSDTWAATDGLGRSLPLHEDVGGPRKDRFVGVFYFLWLGQHSTSGPHDISRILTADPGAIHDGDDPAWGPMGHFHHWAEPYFGYYLSDDAWVIRRHATMLADAGVDTVVFDVTNGFTYRSNYRVLLDTFAAVRADGGTTPQVAFLAPFGTPRQVVSDLYADLYEPGVHADLWFRWDGKPLILADPDLLGDGTDEIRSFFTFRSAQPSYFTGPAKPDQWGWLEVSPQHVFRDASGAAEQMTVGVAQNAVDGRLGAMSEPRALGRSARGGEPAADRSRTPEGLNVQEQWDRALATDPEFVFVTGWNEWVAQRMTSFNGVDAPVVFVDQFDWEHSRDIEPLRGGPEGGFPEGDAYQDAYYYQLVANIRRFKGVRPLPRPTAPRTIPVNGRFEDWRDVGPEYRDHIGDTAHRDHPGWGGAGPYVETSGRNDIIAAKVARDREHLYFYARTREPLSPWNGRNWMLLFLDVGGDGDGENDGWEGFRFVVNRRVRDGHRTSLEASRGGWSWRHVADVSYAARGNELELAVPRRLVGADPRRPLRLDFKWIDNMQRDGAILDVLTSGDAAPSGRFRYRFAE